MPLGRQTLSEQPLGVVTLLYKDRKRGADNNQRAKLQHDHYRQSPTTLCKSQGSMQSFSNGFSNGYISSTVSFSMPILRRHQLKNNHETCIL
ncbi:hypothetical protein A2U01_0051921 [Trifolium medium]|uniref:Uncharacterized protein n=1 Tax=Trifolium medium TaxID=97028 RepID=A0A392R4I5_9FABA|nr:hypothetical protein [Trifolium medium]